MNKGKYECVCCGVQETNHCSYCNRKNKLIKFNFKINDFVRLNKQAIKEFYGTNELVSMYERNGEMDSQGFVHFTAKYLGFESGEKAGIITEIRESNIRVKFFSPELAVWNFAYYGYTDLDLIQEA